MFCPCFVISHCVSFHNCNHLDGEERAGCFTLIGILMSCDIYCSVALPHGSMGLSAGCDCGIF